MGRTDRQTDGFLIDIPRLHSCSAVKIDSNDRKVTVSCTRRIYWRRGQEATALQTNAYVNLPGYNTETHTSQS